MVRRTSCSTQSLHFLNQIWLKFLWSNKCFSFLEKICLIGRSATFSNKKELVLIAVCSKDINLCRKVTSGILLIVHIQRNVLGISQVVICICIKHAMRKSLLITATGENKLAFLCNDCSSTCILTERKLSFCRNICIH